MSAWTSWADRARAVISQVVQANPDVQGLELKKLLSKSYPFGERAYHPYKVWLREVKRAVERPLTRAVTKPVQEIPGQESFFFGC